MEQETIQVHHEKCEESKSETKKRGPWNDEPNRLNWKHKGLDCMLVRHFSSLHWCGYVGLEKSHPLHGVDYNDDRLNEVRVHGGMTYSESCGGFVCHIKEDGSDETWWIGFDCAHSGDISPRHDSNEIWNRGVYRDMGYVKQQTERLADQLFLLGEGNGTFIRK